MKNRLLPPRAGRSALALLLLAAPLLTRAQVGIGTSTPDPKAALDVRATDRGVLVPRLSAGQRTGIAAPPQGLLVYQTDAPEGFYYFGGGAWVYLNPSPGGAGDNLGNHLATQALNLQANPLVGSGSSVGAAVGLGVRADGGLNLAQNTAGFNLLIGYQAGAAVTGTQNQFVGYQSGQATTSGSNNLFEGLRSGYANTSGTNNLFLGTQSGFSNLTGSANLFLGVNSGYANTNGTDNLFLGLEAGRYNTSGAFNLFAGSASGQGNTSGAYNVMLGYVSGQNALTGTGNTFVGAASGQANTSGSTNVFSGFQAGYRNTSADNNTFSGNAAGSGTTTGGGNVFSGAGAGQANATGTFNTALGYGANLSTANLTNATAVGANALVGQSNTLVLGNGASVGIGTSTPGQKLEVAGQVFSSSGGFRFPDNSVQTTAAVVPAPQTLSVSGQALSISGGNTVTLPAGGGAGDNLGDGMARSNVNLQGYAITGTGASITSVGLGVRADGGLNIGQNSFSQAVSVGYMSGGVGVGCTYIGISSGAAALNGYSNTYVGSRTGASATYGQDDTFVGADAGQANNANANTFVGAFSGSTNTQGGGNSFLGYLSGARNSTGANNCFLGADSGFNNDAGTGNTFVGSVSGQYNTSGNNNVALGYQTGSGLFIGGLSNTVALGYNAAVYASNAVRLGNNSITLIEGQVPFSNPSDARFKYDIRPDVPGLAFIGQLKPVTYRFDGTKLDAYARTGTLPAGFTEDPAARVQSGFLAQQVEQAAQAVGYAFDGLHTPANARDHYSLSYSQFVVPLVRAVQEQQAQIEALTRQHTADEAARAADHAALLDVQAQVARLLGEVEPRAGVGAGH